MSKNIAAVSLESEPTERTVAVKPPNRAMTIHEAYVNVCAGVENVKRDTAGQAGGAKYKYATLDSVLAVTQPLLKENGLALAQYVHGDRLVARLIHHSGETIDFGYYELGAIAKHQERGMAITYGRRYQLCSIFGIAQEDDDARDIKTEKKTKIFSTAKLRTDWSIMFEARMNNCGSLEDLKDCWNSEKDILLAMQNSEDDSNVYIYDHLEKTKDAIKAQLQAAMKQYGIE